MSNAKNIQIEAEVPFFWLNELTDQERSLFASWLLAPTGLTLEYGRRWYVPNDHGGMTTTYEIQIHGIEAIPAPALQKLTEALERVGTLWAAEMIDLDDGNSVGHWAHIEGKTGYWDPAYIEQCGLGAHLHDRRFGQ